MSDGHTMADVGNLSFRDTESPGYNVTDSINYDLLLKEFNKTKALSITIFVICLVGLVGNGLVLGFLFFKIQKNHCVIYIINLAIADTTFLVGCFIITVSFICVQNGVQVSQIDAFVTLTVGGIMYNIGFNASSFVLVAISLERCLSVFSPMWYHRRQLKKQCIIVCVLLWALSCLVMVLEEFVCDNKVEYLYPGSEKCTAVYLFTSALYILVVILMIISSMTLLIDIQKTSKKCHPLRLYIIILLTILIFHLSVVPGRVLGLLLYFKVLSSNVYTMDFFNVTFICTSIYCSYNPYVYIFVAIGRRQCCRHSIQQALEKIFNEETESSIQRRELSS